MSYIGKQPVSGNFQVCDAISVVNGQAAYTMQVSSANVSPESANHMLVSLNGVLQKPGSSFTISGSTITFASNLATGDVIDFILLLGNVNDIGTPSDATVTTAKLGSDAVTEAKIADDAVESEHLNNNIISGQTALAESPADTDEFLVSDGGTIKRIDYSHIKGGGAYTKLLHTAITSSTTNIDFNSTYITSSYNDFMFVIEDLKSASEAFMTMKLSADNGSSFKNDIHFIVKGFDANNSDHRERNESGNASAITLTPVELRAEADANGFYKINLFGHADSDQCASVQFTGGFENNSGRAVCLYGYGFDTATPRTVNFVRFVMASGNFELAKVTLYGRSV